MKGFVLKNDKIKHFVERERQNAAFGVQASAGLWLWIPDTSLQQAWFEVAPHQTPAAPQYVPVQLFVWPCWEPDV